LRILAPVRLAGLSAGALETGQPTQPIQIANSLDEAIPIA
jgi:hypothetical protein